MTRTLYMVVEHNEPARISLIQFLDLLSEQNTKT